LTRGGVREQESYVAAMVMGAGIVECDVAVTKDGELVCRHAQCDLHTTTNILQTPLASKCKVPYDPAHPGSTVCCTSDLTLSEFKSLRGKMDAANTGAETVGEYMDATASWRTDLYSAYQTSPHGKLVTHKESIELIKKWGRKATPELKTYSQGPGMISYDEVRAKIVQEYKDAGFPASDVWLQSFNLPDVQYWIAREPAFGEQAVYLDDTYCDGTKNGCKDAVVGGERSPMYDDFQMLRAMGVNYIAPPMQMLVKAAGGAYAASEYALAAKAAGMKIITWTLERSGPLGSGGGWYYGTVNSITNNDGDMLELVHVLYEKVGVAGIFSDWPATTSFYANCKISPRTRTCSSSPAYPASLGPRPAFLVDDMAASELKSTLQECLADDSMVFTPHDFSIGHRGACMMFPEHTEVTSDAGRLSVSCRAPCPSVA
jgi:glycerophosphoryl diester phosphodiesterase